MSCSTSLGTSRGAKRRTARSERTNLVASSPFELILAILQWPSGPRLLRLPPHLHPCGRAGAVHRSSASAGTGRGRAELSGADPHLSRDRLLALQIRAARSAERRLSAHLNRNPGTRA